MNIYIHTLVAFSLLFFAYRYGRICCRNEIAHIIMDIHTQELARQGFLKTKVVNGERVYVKVNK